MEKASFAAGCFWGVESSFRKIKGVLKTRVGYTGGSLVDPSYENVCSGDSGHAEAIEVEFDPGQITYFELLNVFWSIHDPTTKDRQGPDIGSQYRSAIFFHTPEQKVMAQQSKQSLEESGTLKTPVSTEIVSISTFYPAEEYHQQYIEKRKP